MGPTRLAERLMLRPCARCVKTLPAGFTARRRSPPDRLRGHRGTLAQVSGLFAGGIGDSVGPSPICGQWVRGCVAPTAAVRFRPRS
jgi:hypothetical protein